MTVSRAMGSTTVTIWGSNFVASAAPSGGAAPGVTAAGSDDHAAASLPPHNAAGCRVGTAWVAPLAVTRNHIACVVPWRSPGAPPAHVTFYDIQDPITGGGAPLAPALHGSRGVSAPHGIEVLPSVAPVEGGTSITFFGRLGRAPAAAAASLTCADELAPWNGGGEGSEWSEGSPAAAATRGVPSVTLSSSSLSACISAPRPAGFVAVPQAAVGNLLGLVAAPGGAVVSFSYVARPVVFGVHPREGPGGGGEPVWLAGRNLHVTDSPGVPTHCIAAAFGEGGGAGVAIPAQVVSSALLVCERPAPSEGGSVLAPYNMRLEAGAEAVGWSIGNQVHPEQVTRNLTPSTQNPKP